MSISRNKKIVILIAAIIIMCVILLRFVLAPILLDVLISEGQSVSVRIDDVTKTHKLVLTTSRDLMSISGISIHVTGYLDGTATIVASNWEPKKLSGKIDWQIYHDWFSNTCEIDYLPENVSQGKLTLEYIFH